MKNAERLPSDAAAHIGAEVALDPGRNGVADVVGFGGRKRIDGWVFLVYVCISVRHWVRRRLKASSRTVAIPVIVVSGTIDTTHADLVRALGAENFLPKPVDPEELVAAIERAVGPAPAR